MEGNAIDIRSAGKEELDTVQSIQKAAFGQNGEARLIANLIANLLDDPTAKPCLSLMAFIDDLAVGHILFSRVTIDGAARPIGAAILAPLAVLPEFQGQAIGGKLIREGLARLAGDGAELVFVLGHPDYYSRFGFHPAEKKGFTAPYPIPPEHADAWMVQEVVAGAIDSLEGRVRCADALDKPELWSE